MLFQVFSGSVDEYEPKVSEACDATRQLLDKDKGGSDLEATLMAVSDSWNSLGESIAKRKEKLEDGLTKAKHFKDMHDEMTTWLDETEEEIGKLAQTSIHSDVLQKQLEACKVTLLLAKPFGHVPGCLPSVFVYCQSVHLSVRFSFTELS